MYDVLLNPLHFRTIDGSCVADVLTAVLPGACASPWDVEAPTSTRLLKQRKHRSDSLGDCNAITLLPVSESGRIAMPASMRWSMFPVVVARLVLLANKIC